MSAHTSGPVTAERMSSHGDAWEVLDDETVAITIARCTGRRAEGNAKRIEALWNAFECPPYGYHWEVVHHESGEIVNSGFCRTDPPKEGQHKVGASDAFEMRVTPVVAVAKALGSKT